MNNWHAQVTDSFASFDQEVRLAQVFDREVNVAARVSADGTVEMERQTHGQEVPALLKLPREALEALRDALNREMPPTDDRDLRDALRVERERVDRVLGTIAGTR